MVRKTDRKERDKVFLRMIKEETGAFVAVEGI
jgi:hypothetical protein